MTLAGLELSYLMGERTRGEEYLEAEAPVQIAEDAEPAGLGTGDLLLEVLLRPARGSLEVLRSRRGRLYPDHQEAGAEHADRGGMHLIHGPSIIAALARRARAVVP